MSGWMWYALSVVAAWALHIVYDATNSPNGRLDRQVYYVAFSLVWPLVMLAVVLVPAYRATCKRISARPKRPVGRKWYGILDKRWVRAWSRRS